MFMYHELFFKNKIRRQDFRCFRHKEWLLFKGINTLPSSDIVYCRDMSKYHWDSINTYNVYMCIKIFQLKIKRILFLQILSHSEVLGGQGLLNMNLMFLIMSLGGYTIQLIEMKKWDDKMLLQDLGRVAAYPWFPLAQHCRPSGSQQRQVHRSPFW